jgi:hypothetical protein
MLALGRDNGSDILEFPRGLDSAGRGGGAMATRCVMVPCSWVCCDSFDMFRTCPRGIPSPAELPRSTILLLDIVDAEPRLTITVRVPFAGACGTTYPFGGFITRGCAYQVLHTPPGCHPQPNPGTNTHVP